MKKVKKPNPKIIKEPGNDPYAPVMALMKAENQKAIDNLLKTAREERKKAAAELAEAQAELAEAEQSEPSLTAEWEKKHRDKLASELRKKVSGEVALQLLQAGNSVGEVAALLDLPDAFVLGIAESVGIVRSAEESAHTAASAATMMWIEYESMARGGYIVFHWGKIVCKFWWEFGTGSTLAFIDVPKAEDWEAVTAIPLERRDVALHFIGEKVASEQGHGLEKYRLDSNAIVILRR